jgi:hypothetical protein
VDIENHMATDIIGGGTKFRVKGQNSEEQQSSKKRSFRIFTRELQILAQNWGGGLNHTAHPLFRRL